MVYLDGAMIVEGKEAKISRYEVMEAFFRTEEEENFAMASELNKMLNAFCEQERLTRANVVSLSFDIEKYGNVIQYIGARASVN